MTMDWSDWIGTASYVVLAASYLVTNMYWLRMLAIIAIVAEAIYFYMAGDRELWVGILWSCVFVAINIVQLALLVRARMRVKLTEEERMLHESAFGKLDHVNFGRLLSVGGWHDYQAGTELTRQAEPVEMVHLLVRGRATVDIDGDPIASILPGAYIGEMAFLGDGKASATVRAGDNCRCFSIPADDLHDLVRKHDEIGSVLKEQFAVDLARKLRVHGRNYVAAVARKSLSGSRANKV
ncbi:cyclic nucleotide-binding domain-containing protein [Dongia soli]|uniref:Cyclic nucleotide-binding domain-containing protein n=1 Tax=Dongia soli TaxID=600628 RepID=A0ABU5ECJ2_9PROT|nr:cyclic nucleotide-binding domain-containing protein [Dongia soli]MDY0883509.1 cyclic nucleotide-binding domain-containing protein [Dongia soli]